MTADEKTRTLAEIVRGIVQGLHDDGSDHILCHLRGTDACAIFSGAFERLDRIIKDCKRGKGVKQHG